MKPSINHTASRTGNTSYLKATLKWVLKYAFGLGISCGIAAFLCICFSMNLTGSTLAIICLIFCWLDDVKNEINI